MSIGTDRKSLALALVDAEDLSKSHLDIISGQVDLIGLGLKDKRYLESAKQGLAMLELYLSDMITHAELLTKEAKDAWSIVSKEEE